MTDREQIWQCAKRDLVLAVPPGREDVFLWEHCRRVAENAIRIAALPEVASSHRIDPVPLEAAGLYHDAGWAQQYRSGRVALNEVLVRPTHEAQRELGVQIMEESLARCMDRPALESAMNTVRRLSERPVVLLESRVLSDAENLDEIGNLALWGLIRRNAGEGKGAAEAIRTWRAQRQYGFWNARIEKSFHFDAVRRKAGERLARLDAILEEIARLHTGADLEGLA